MRRFLPILFGLLGCQDPPVVPPQGPTGAPVDEVPQAKFVVGVRTTTAAPISARLSDGSVLEVERWALVLSAVEVHLCESAWRSWLVPNAWAHVSDSTTRLGTPVVEDLMQGAGGAKIIGEIAPPSGTYCRAYAVFTPADDDALNYTALSDVEGNTSVLIGRWVPPDGQPVPVHWTWQGRRAVRIALDAVAMQSDTAQFQLLVDKHVDAALFEALSPDQVRAGLAMDDLMGRLFERVKLYEAP